MQTNHIITFTNKLTCFCWLALLCHIPQEVLLNTNLLWKNTQLPSLNTVVLASNSYRLNITFSVQNTDLPSLLLFVILSYMLSMTYFICPVWFNLKCLQVKSKFRDQFSKHPQHHNSNNKVLGHSLLTYNVNSFWARFQSRHWEKKGN